MEKVTGEKMGRSGKDCSQEVEPLKSDDKCLWLVQEKTCATYANLEKWVYDDNEEHDYDADNNDDSTCMCSEYLCESVCTCKAAGYK